MSFLQNLFARPRTAAGRADAPASERRLREMFDAAASIVVMAGGGLSDPGPPTVSAEGDAAPRPIRFRHFLIDPEARREQWRRSLAEAAAADAARPNRAHAALAGLSRTRRLKVVAQSTDGLLRRAGMHADDLVEIHGRADLAVCTKCGHGTPIQAHAEAVAAGLSPTCARDGAILKPGVTLFGETPLRSATIRAEEWAHACDLLVVAGAALDTLPSGNLPEEARASGARIALVHRGPPARPLAADLVVDGDVAGAVAGLAG